MSNVFIRAVIRNRFNLTSREKAGQQARDACQRYLDLSKEIDADQGKRQIEVPCMLGIDEDMRRWSFFMVLEHNTIVNRCITSMVEALAQGKEPTGMGALNPKTDVMPSRDPGIEQVDALRASVDDHLEVVSGLDQLRGGLTKDHPLFGPFDAHRWHCMFGFHLKVHYKQVLYIKQKLATH